jgi:hypothetical protein
VLTRSEADDVGFEGEPAMLVLPVFATTTLKVARRPAVTVNGSSRSSTALAAGTLRSTSATELP